MDALVHLHRLLSAFGRIYVLDAEETGTGDELRKEMKTIFKWRNEIYHSSIFLDYFVCGWKYERMKSNFE